jgi:hypothetical protein
MKNPQFFDSSTEHIAKPGAVLDIRRTQGPAEPRLETLGGNDGERHRHGTDVVEPGMIFVFLSQVLMDIGCRVALTPCQKGSATDLARNAPSAVFIAEP